MMRRMIVTIQWSEYKEWKDFCVVLYDYAGENCHRIIFSWNILSITLKMRKIALKIHDINGSISC